MMPGSPAWLSKGHPLNQLGVRQYIAAFPALQGAGAMVMLLNRGCGHEHERPAHHLAIARVQHHRVPDSQPAVRGRDVV
jgi:hypothetical protein